MFGAVVCEIDKLKIVTTKTVNSQILGVGYVSSLVRWVCSVQFLVLFSSRASVQYNEPEA